MKTNRGLIKYAESWLYSPYWYGTFGQRATLDLLRRKRVQYPSHYTTNRIPTYQKHLGRKVFDCIGLIKGYLWSEGSGDPIYNPSEDWSADMTLSRCEEKGTMRSMPDTPGVLLFFPGHVGVYVGNNQVIEARGFNYGVVRTPLSGRPWRFWGKHPLIRYLPEGPRLKINDRVIDTQIKNEGGRIFVLLEGEGGRKHWVQIRALNDLLGGSLKWIQSEQTAEMIISTAEEV